MTAAKIRGVILEEGGKTSHVAIVARALGIPAVGQAAGLIDLVDTGSSIIVDGGTGELFVRPSAGPAESPMPKRCASMRASRRSMQALRDVPAITKDGVQHQPQHQCRA